MKSGHGIRRSTQDEPAAGDHADAVRRAGDHYAGFGESCAATSQSDAQRERSPAPPASIAAAAIARQSRGARSVACSRSTLVVAPRIRTDPTFTRASSHVVPLPPTCRRRSDARHRSARSRPPTRPRPRAAAASQCHQDVGDLHDKRHGAARLLDCHGGDPDATDKEHGPRPAAVSARPGRPRPTRSARYTLLNHESPEFIRFVNPGDLRIAHISCGTAGCHPKEVLQSPQEHDDARLHAVGRGPLQQRLGARTSRPATAKATA